MREALVALRLEPPPPSTTTPRAPPFRELAAALATNGRADDSSDPVVLSLLRLAPRVAASSEPKACRV